MRILVFKLIVISLLLGIAAYLIPKILLGIIVFFALLELLLLLRLGSKSMGSQIVDFEANQVTRIRGISDFEKIELRSLFDAVYAQQATTPEQEDLEVKLHPQSLNP